MNTIFFVLFLSFLAYSNGSRAKRKGRSAGLHAFLTVLLYITGEVAGMFVVIILFCRDILRYNIASGGQAMKEVQSQIEQAFLNNPLHSITIDLFGLGGFLLVRYIIDKYPDRNDKMPTWPGGDSGQQDIT